MKEDFHVFVAKYLLESFYCNQLEFTLVVRYYANFLLATFISFFMSTRFGTRGILLSTDFDDCF